MKKSCILFTLVALVLMAGCQKDDSADVKELFSNIPGTASYVVVADLHSILEKSGSKVDDGKVQASPELQAVINSGRDIKTRQLMQAILNGDSGVEPTVAVAFADGFSQYVVGNLLSTSAFEATVVKFLGGEWEERDGVRYNANYAITGNRYWIGKEGARIDVDKIRTYLALSQKQSFADSDFAPMLEDTDADLAGWCDINGVMNVTGVGFEQRAMTKMGIEALFKGADFAVFDVRFDKGAMNMTARMLDDKGRDAKFLYASKKIDETVFSRIGGNADVVVAMAVPQKLVKQLQEQVSGQLSMIGFVVKAMSCVDGTVAVALDESKDVKGLVQTNDQNTSDLMSLLQEMGMKSTKEGKDVLFTQGEMKGTENVTALGTNLKGCVFGVSMTPTLMGPSYGGFGNIVMKLVPKSGGVQLEVQVKGKDASENIMMTFLKAAASK